MFFCVIITCRCSAMQQQTSETSKQNTVRRSKPTCCFSHTNM